MECSYTLGPWTVGARIRRVPIGPACLLLKCSQKRCEQTSGVGKVRENVPGFFVLVPRFTLHVSECDSVIGDALK